MATRRDSAGSGKQAGRTAGRSTKSVSTERYPEWKVELFRAGMAERRQSAAAQISGRAMRAPGA